MEKQIKGLVKEIIEFLKKRDLWKDVAILYNGKQYSSYPEKNVGREIEGVYILRYRMPLICLLRNKPPQKAKLVIYCEGAPLSKAWKRDSTVGDELDAIVAERNLVPYIEGDYCALYYFERRSKKED